MVPNGSGNSQPKSQVLVNHTSSVITHRIGASSMVKGGAPMKK